MWFRMDKLGQNCIVEYTLSQCVQYSFRKKVCFFYVDMFVPHLSIRYIYTLQN